MYFRIILFLVFFFSCGQNLADPTTETDFIIEDPNNPPPVEWSPFFGKIYFSDRFGLSSDILSVEGQTGLLTNEFALGDSYMPKVNDNDVMLFSSSNATPFISIQTYDLRTNSNEIVLSLNKNLLYPRATEAGHRIAYVIDSNFDSLMYYDIASQTSVLIYPAVSTDQSIKAPVWNTDNTEVYFQLQVGFDNYASDIRKVNVNTLVSEVIIQGAFPKLWSTNQRMIYALDGAIWEINLINKISTLIVSTGLSSQANNPVYAPSGGQIAFSALVNGFFKIHIVDYNGQNLRYLELGNIDSAYLDWIN